MPTFRRPQLMKRAVFSILNQSYGDFCVRIFDNASGDGTEDVARDLMRLDPRVHYHRHPQNIGGLQNMIYGMERVTTPYFNILCDDDLLMPGFLETGAALHERSEEPMAFAAARVVVVDGDGRIGEPYPHPAEPRRFSPPDGVIQCLRSGLSMPGVIYLTSAMAEIGAPRTTWWNWTESGWNALAAMRFPIAFTPEVGAIVLVHPGSASKQMDGTEFRVSWFEMLAELRAAAASAGLSDAWWNREVRPLAWSRFCGTVTRLCTNDGATYYERLGKLAVLSGLNAVGVRAAVAVARAARILGLGVATNLVIDVLRDRGRGVASGSGAAEPLRSGGALRAAHTVFTELNRQVGLG